MKKIDTLISDSLWEKLIVGFLIAWIVLPAICIIMLSMNFAFHPLMVKLTPYWGYILLILSFWVFVKRKAKIDLKQNLPYCFLIAMLVWIFISAIFSTNKEIAFWGYEFRKEGALAFLGYTGFFCGMLALSKEKYRKIVFDTFLWVAVFQSIVSFLNYIGLDILTMGYVDGDTLYRAAWKWTGAYHNPNHFGYYLTMAIMYAGYTFVLNKKSCIYLISYIILAITLVFNNTLGCFIAVVITLILGSIFLYIKDKKTLKKNIVLIALLIVITTMITITANEGIISSLIQTGNEIGDIAQGEIDGDAGSGRMELWLGALQFIGERPLVGYGPDNLYEYYKKIGVDNGKTHNEYLQYMAECGIPTLIFYLSAIGIIFVRRIKNIKKLSNAQVTFMGVCGAYLISAFFGCTMVYTMPYFWMALAIV